MIREAELHAEEDRRQRERVELRNQAEHLLYTSGKTLQDLGEKLRADEKSRIEEARKALEEALRQENKDNDQEIRDKMEALTRILGEATTRIYQEAGAQAQAQTRGASADGSPGQGSGSFSQGGRTVEGEVR